MCRIDPLVALVALASWHACARIRPSWPRVLDPARVHAAAILVFLPSCRAARARPVRHQGDARVRAHRGGRQDAQIRAASSGVRARSRHGAREPQPHHAVPSGLGVSLCEGPRLGGGPLPATSTVLPLPASSPAPPLVLHAVCAIHAVRAIHVVCAICAPPHARARPPAWARQVPADLLHELHEGDDDDGGG
eukprot:3295906-Prymnesium_polylepis.1